MASHHVLGDRVRVYKRERSSAWQASARLEGKEWRTSTKTDSLSQAKEFAEDWYFELRGKSRIGAWVDWERSSGSAHRIIGRDRSA